MIQAVQGFLEAHSAIIGLLILAAMFVEFLRERFPVPVVALLGTCAFLVTGLLDSPGFFGTFSNSAPIAVGAMLILSGALMRTGAIEAIINVIVARAERHPRLAVVEVFAGLLLASPFLNNTPVVVIMIPIMFRLAQATGIPAKRLLMPMSILAVLGGCLSLIGTSTNLIVDGIARKEGMAPFGIFEITPYGLAGVAAGIVTLLLLIRLLPSDPVSTETASAGADYLTELTPRADSQQIDRPLTSLPVFKGGVKLLGLRRGAETVRTGLEERRLRRGDRLVVRASAVELMTLRTSRDFEIGLGGPTSPSADVGAAVETMISPSHPSIGRRLGDIPFLSRVGVRVLGVSRHNHLPGPDLGNARIRAADRLLVTGEPRQIQQLRENRNLLGVDLTLTRPFRRAKAPVAIGALAATVAVAAFDLVPISIAAVVAIGVILATRCIDAEEAWSSIDGNVLILIIAMLAVGTGLEQAGSVALMVSWFTPLLGHASPTLLVFLIYFVTLLLSELLSNNAVAAIVTPVVIQLAIDLGIDPRPLIIAVMIGASACFATPIGYQTNALVYTAGEYRFADFVRIGVPTNIIVGVAVCLSIVALG
ncbi:sodium:sulfate symporter [Croceibacterium mercuriale]|uniref:Sodium:sulfate symporter n=1 Tax=Croceibacterium mercuriale TaxID=1572751 RepID=A0A0B2BZX8_9SPHN|nr:SLC13 family permease [Croceibacterium mercuriale]KHL25587.1 sodium:sulfate symporter [Croceibacterium mercuriale]